MTEFNPLLDKSKIRLKHTDSSEQEDDNTKPLLRIKSGKTEQESIRYRPKSMSMISRSQYATAEFHSTTTTSHSSLKIEQTRKRPKSLVESTMRETYVPIDKAEKLFIKSIAVTPSRSQTQVVTSAKSVDSLLVERQIRSVTSSEPLVVEELTNDPPALNISITDGQATSVISSTVTSPPLIKNVEEREEEKGKVSREDGATVKNFVGNESTETSSGASFSSDNDGNNRDRVGPPNIVRDAAYQHPTKISSPIELGVESTIEINRGIHELGINVIGGSDTVMGSVYVLDVLDNGMAAKDGRLWPGDQILSANNTDLRTANHEQVIEVFRLSPALVRLVVLRDSKRSEIFLRCQRKIKVPILSYWDRVNKEKDSDVYDLYEAHLKKKANQSLGLCIIGRRNDPGVFITEVTSGSAAAKDGSIKRGDQILAINGKDIKMAGQEAAAHLVKNSQGNVHLSMGRLKAGIPDDLMDMPMSSQLKTDNVSQPSNAGQEKQTTRFVEIEKPFNTPLGIYIAGGLGSPLGDVPVFVALVEETNVVGNKLKCGDIISSVNGQSTENKTHDEVVQMMSTADDMIILMQVQDATPEIHKLTSYLSQTVSRTSFKVGSDEKKSSFDRPKNIISVESKKAETFVY